MRAKLVAIHAALDKYKNDSWIGIFTDSQASLHAIQNQLQLPSHTTYHHHKPLIAAIVNTLHYRASLCLPTQINKIRGHTNIRGNDLADAAIKLVVTSFEDIPEHQKLIITIRTQAKRSRYKAKIAPNSLNPLNSKHPTIPYGTGYRVRYGTVPYITVR